MDGPSPKLAPSKPLTQPSGNDNGMGQPRIKQTASVDYGTQFAEMDRAEEKLQSLLLNPDKLSAAALSTAIANMETARGIQIHKIKVALESLPANTERDIAAFDAMIAKVHNNPDAYPPGTEESLMHARNNATTHGSSPWDAFPGIIGDKQKYVDVFKDAMAKHVDLSKAISDLITEMGGWIHTGGEANTMEINLTEIANLLHALIYEFSSPNAALFTSELKGDAGLAEVQRVAREFGRDPSYNPNEGDRSKGSIGKIEHADGTVTYYLKPDLTSVGKMQASLYKLQADNPNKDYTKLVINMATFNIWEAGNTAQKENMKNDTQMLTERFSRANTQFDNLVKLFSSLMSSMVDMMKGFLNS